ncbi:hypothetical protein VZT92_017309 [Zoarces viviparus]|uniref:Uncharacterized protein n=1 Tax=Zoarces viviparus TaxID=48416 RepID=A0AAW1ERP3_ZOAVI
MKIVLLITVTLALTLVHAWNDQPCQKNNNNNANNQFVLKHILPEGFDINSMDKWKEHLKGKDVCKPGRSKQSFLKSSDKDKVGKICGDGGHLFKGNFCISDSTMLVYNFEVNKNCDITKGPDTTNNPVIVACDEIDSKCVPVHFEKYIEGKVTDYHERCSP